MANNIKERLDKLKDKIQTEDFLQGRGLSNEVNIWMFCYEAKDEQIVSHTVEQIKSDTLLWCHIHECNLYDIFINICRDKRILDRIDGMEERKGTDFLLRQLQSNITVEQFVKKMQYEMTPGKDVLLITGVGNVFPFMRIHALLEGMQPYFSSVPVLVMYPGTFNGSAVRLFDILKPNPYYRAFNII